MTDTSAHGKWSQDGSLRKLDIFCGWLRQLSTEVDVFVLDFRWRDVNVLRVPWSNNVYPECSGCDTGRLGWVVHHRLLAFHRRYLLPQALTTDFVLTQYKCISFVEDYGYTWFYSTEARKDKWFILLLCNIICEQKHNRDVGTFFHCGTSRLRILPPADGHLPLTTEHVPLKTSMILEHHHLLWEKTVGLKK